MQLCQTTIIEVIRSAKPKPQNMTAKLAQLNGLSGSQQYYTAIHCSALEMGLHLTETQTESLWKQPPMPNPIKKVLYWNLNLLIYLLES